MYACVIDDSWRYSSSGSWRMQVVCCAASTVWFLSFHVKNHTANGLNLHGRDVPAVNDFPVKPAKCLKAKTSNTFLFVLDSYKAVKLVNPAAAGAG